jgi:hypothetical protein
MKTEGGKLPVAPRPRSNLRCGNITRLALVGG